MTNNPPRYEPPEFNIGKYILKYRKPVPCNDLIKWGLWMERNRRHVRSTYVGDVWVSTVFLGLDHNYVDGDKPLLFETMIFPDQEVQYRCSTWREALHQHWYAVNEVKSSAKLI